MSKIISSQTAWTPRYQQQCFRRILDAVGYPGCIEHLGHSAPPLLAVLACLADRMSTIHDRDDLVSESDRRLLGAQFTDLDQAQFVVADGIYSPSSGWTPPQGTLSSPEFGATLLLQCEDLEEGELSVEIEGPGVPKTIFHRLTGLHPGWIRQREAWVADFPKGVDFILLGKREILAWPRTTKIRIR